MLIRLAAWAAALCLSFQEPAEEICSAANGPWSAAATWEKGRVPSEGARVRIREGHRVVYDVVSDKPLRSILIGGTLSFAPDRDTRLDVGLINIQAGDAATETGL